MKQEVNVRRVSAILESISEVLARCPDVIERTARYFAGELEEGAMVKEQTTIMLDAEMLERAEALVEAVARIPTVAIGGRVTRSTVIRLALLRGMDVLEQELKPTPKKKK